MKSVLQTANHPMHVIIAANKQFLLHTVLLLPASLSLERCREDGQLSGKHNNTVNHPSVPCSPGVLNNHRQPFKKCSSQRLGEQSIREGHYIALQSGWSWVRRKEGKISKLNRRQVLTLPGIEKWLQIYSGQPGIRAESPSKTMFSR